VTEHTIDRREFLRLGGMATAAGTALPLLGSALQAFPAQAATAATVPPADPDQLFRQGRFDAADRGYAQELRQDPRQRACPRPARLHRPAVGPAQRRRGVPDQGDPAESR
jgi:hypothetical protein